jgi:hypothetical protein
MDNKLPSVLKTLNDGIREAQQCIKEIQNELATARCELKKVKLERDTYKEMLTQGNTKEHTLAYMTIHSCDNGEGVDTETCVGVFTTKPLALQAILDVCKKNEELSVDDFRIEDFDVGKALNNDEIVHVEQHDEEAHCEVSTRIIGILCDASKHTATSHSYLREYCVDKVYCIEY